MYITGNKNKKKQNYLFKIYWHLYYVLSIYCSAAYGNNFYFYIWQNCTVKLHVMLNHVCCITYS